MCFREKTKFACCDREVQTIRQTFSRDTRESEQKRIDDCCWRVCELLLESCSECRDVDYRKRGAPGICPMGGGGFNV